MPIFFFKFPTKKAIIQCDGDLRGVRAIVLGLQMRHDFLHVEQKIVTSSAGIVWLMEMLDDDVFLQDEPALKYLLTQWAVRNDASSFEIHQVMEDIRRMYGQGRVLGRE